MHDMLGVKVPGWSGYSAVLENGTAAKGGAMYEKMISLIDFAIKMDR